MIFDLLAHQALYRSLSPRFAAGFDWLLRFDPSTPDGRIAIQGDDVFALVQTITTGPAAEKRFESHVKYADIQCVISGTELMQFAPRSSLPVLEPYDLSRDIAFHADPSVSSDVICGPGSFALFFPHDGHKPCCLAGTSQRVQKAVIKVRV